MLADTRAKLVEKIGLNTYRGLFSLFSVAALVLVVVGWRSVTPTMVYAPPFKGGVTMAVVMFAAFVLFVASLRSGEPLLLRIVRARGIPISAHGPRYLTRLTAVWAAFFVVNGLVALWTTTTSPSRSSWRHSSPLPRTPGRISSRAS